MSFLVVDWQIASGFVSENVVEGLYLHLNPLTCLFLCVCVFLENSCIFFVVVVAMLQNCKNLN